MDFIWKYLIIKKAPTKGAFIFYFGRAPNALQRGRVLLPAPSASRKGFRPVSSLRPLTQGLRNSISC